MEDYEIWLISFFIILLLFVLSMIGVYIYRVGSKSKKSVGDYMVVRRFPDSDKAAEKIHRLGLMGMKIAWGDIPYPPDTFHYEAIMQLREKFKPKNIIENDTVSSMGHSSKTVDMKYIYMSLRKKNGKFYDDNLIDFVFLHELAHVATPTKYLIRDGSVSYDDGMHTPTYWSVNSMLLHMAKDLGMYKPRDYSVKPEKYNNIVFNSNPYFNSLV